MINHFLRVAYSTTIGHLYTSHFHSDYFLKQYSFFAWNQFCVGSASCEVNMYHVFAIYV